MPSLFHADRLFAWGSARPLGLAVGFAIGLALFLHPLALGRTVVAGPWWVPLGAAASVLATLAGDRRSR